MTQIANDKVSPILVLPRRKLVVIIYGESIRDLQAVGNVVNLLAILRDFCKFRG